MDILFLFPPASGNRGSFLPHLGTAYLQAALTQAGISSGQFHCSLAGNTGEIAKAVLESKPSIVGLTVYDSNLGVALNIAHHIKAQSPSTWIMLGGPTSTFSHQRILNRHRFVDVCALGEMEEAAPSIIEKLLGAADGRPPDSLRSSPGVAFRAEAAVVTSGLPPLVGRGGGGRFQLDQLRSPYLSGVLTDGHAGLLTGRGCNQNCVYCCFAAIGRRSTRLHSIDRVLEELDVIAHLARASGDDRVVTFHDDTFTLLPERAKELCARIASRNLGLRFSCITRADKVDDELLRAMKDAGFVAIAFGLESAVPSILRTIGKVRPPGYADASLDPERDFIERVRRSVATAKQLGMLVGVSIILGLPGETRKDGEATVTFVRQLPVDYYMHNLLLVFEGTPLWTTCNRYGIDIEDGPLGLPVLTRYAYDPYSVKPAENCSQLRDASYALDLAVHGLHGCGALGSESRPLSLVVVRSSKLPTATATWLASVLPPGGVVLQVYDAGGDVATHTRQIAADALLFVDSQIPARFYIQLVKVGAAAHGRTKWRLYSPFSRVAETLSKELVTLYTASSAAPLAEWGHTGRSRCDVCEWGSLAEEQSFAEEMAAFLSPEGLARRLGACDAPPAIKYAGRFSDEAPPCAPVSRIEVDEMGTVRLCEDGPFIGKVGDTSRDLISGAEAVLSEGASDKSRLTCRMKCCEGKSTATVKWVQLLSRIPFYVHDGVDQSQQN
jgi:anaerobic magnesium-protoporphyrin IX monomethyl ester cyclase